MPRPSDYTPTRRYLMQAVMMLVLGATIGLAAWVSAVARRASQVELSAQGHAAGDVTVRLPVRWRVRGVGSDPRVIVHAAEVTRDGGGRDGGGRHLRVYIEQLDAPLSPTQYLARNFDAQLYAEDGEVGFAGDAAEAIEIAGQTGILIGSTFSDDRTDAAALEAYACVVLPSRRALVVHLTGPGHFDAKAVATVKQLCGGVVVAKEPPTAGPGDGVTLAEGIRVVAPRQFVPVHEADANRTGRLFWPANLKGMDDADAVEEAWTTIEAVGCLSPSFDEADAAQRERAKAAMTTLLLARDAGTWRSATVEPAGKNVWRADAPRPQGPQSLPAPARAYLTTDPSGRALLTIFRGGMNAGDFDAAWNELSASVKFLPAADTANLEDAGAAEVGRLRRAGYEKLLADRDVEWWLWADGSQRPHVGWSHWNFPLSGLVGKFDLVGKFETRLRRSAAGAVTQAVCDFSYRDAVPHYKSAVTRTESPAPRDGGPPQQYRQTTALAGVDLTFTMKVPANPSPAQWKALPLPGQFVPGPLLPLVMGQLKDDPMLLRTDGFPRYEALGAPDPLGVIIRPDPTSTRKAAGEDQPMRCLSVQVNGSGVTSRWFFRKTGELEVVEWPGGLQMIRSDQPTIGFNFAKDSLLAP